MLVDVTRTDSYRRFSSQILSIFLGMLHALICNTAGNVNLCFVHFAIRMERISENVLEIMANNNSEGRSSFTRCVSAIWFYCQHFSTFRVILRCEFLKRDQKLATTLRQCQNPLRGACYTRQLSTQRFVAKKIVGKNRSV